jgi:hypothetical protein
MSDTRVQQEEQVDLGGRAVINKTQGLVTIFNQSSPAKRKIKCTGGFTDPGETVGIKVVVDDKTAVERLGTGQETEVEGKKIALEALCKSANFTVSS